MKDNPVHSEIKIRELKEVSSSDLLKLFAPTNGCDGCYCMNHHFPDGQAPEGECAKQALLQKKGKQEIQAFIAYHQGAPQGWCAVDKKSQLLGHDCLNHGSEVTATAIHCIFVNEGSRGLGISRMLIEHAIEACRDDGVKSVEAYPFKILSGKKISDPQALFSGPYKVYENLGFVEEETVDDFYTVMRLNL